ncbi:MAG: hypothetical protein FJX75_17600 [Armatimonadetes bacterium]|nr:hypothetical protein [Armatimonadota bacterium]
MSAIQPRSETVYRALLARAKLATAANDALCSEGVYGQARRIDCYSVAASGAGRAYIGALRNNAKCVDVADPEAVQPPGLQGFLIRFRCGRDPGKAKAFSGMSATHGGQWVVLRDSVECVVEYPVRARGS